MIEYTACDRTREKGDHQLPSEVTVEEVRAMCVCDSDWDDRVDRLMLEGEALPLVLAAWSRLVGVGINLVVVPN
jgi:hypothetical protein